MAVRSMGVRIAIVWALMASSASAGITLVHGGALRTAAGSRVVDRVPEFCHDLVDEACSGDILARSIYNLSPDLLSIDVEHVGGANALVGSIGKTVFIPDADVPYSIAGSYAISGSGRIDLRLALYDRTVNQTLFDTRLASTSTPDQMFVVGETGGDVGGYVTGSLTGLLECDHVYELMYTFALSSASGPEALGGFDVTLGSPSVPAPRAAALGLAGTALLLAVRRVYR